MGLRKAKLVIIAALTAAVAACATPPPPPPPVVVQAPPPPPPVFTPPPQPTPPLGATAAMAIPAVGADGLRLTPNRGLGELETLWHFRAAYNVAALNCQASQYFAMADEYNRFLQTHRGILKTANTAIERKYRREHGNNYRRVRDTHTTRVYNFFSLPPVRNEFCESAFLLGRRSLEVPSNELTRFAADALPQLESIFDRFFVAYEQYETDLAAWNAIYGQGAPTRMQAVDGLDGTRGEPLPDNPFGPPAPASDNSAAPQVQPPG